MSQPLKRTIDLLLTIPALVLVSPVMLVIAVMIWSSIGRPILFRHTRPGFRARPFTLLKFRTMRDAADAVGRPLPDADRLTRVGTWVRKLSLDELPQLWNVLRGDMSLVGPRPLLMEYLPRYTPEQARRHEAMPGLTGWAQVNGRNAAPWEERLAMDTWYLDHQSLWLDLGILALTVWKTLLRDGINQPGQATVQHFQGSKRSE